MSKRVAYLHTDFAPYIHTKLGALRERLGGEGIELLAVEGAGLGGLYAGLQSATNRGWWEQLHPDRQVTEVPAARLAADFTRALNRIRPDIVMCGAVAFSSGAASVAWAARTGARVVLLDDARRRNVTAHPLINSIKRCFHLNCDAAFLPAPEWRADYEWWGFPADRQFYGHNALSGSVWMTWSAAVRREADRVRRERELPNHFFLGVGRWIPAKNWPRLIEAYRLYAGTVPNPWPLLLVGHRDGGIDLNSEASRGPGRIILRDHVPRERLADYYALCSGFVLPSINETWGNVVLEAMFCGAPVLVSCLCGCANSLVMEEKNGWRFDPLNTASLAKRLGSFASLPEATRRSMGECSSRIAAEWDLPRYLDGASAAVEFCLSRTKRRGPWWSRLPLGWWHGRYRPV